MTDPADKHTADDNCSLCYRAAAKRCMHPWKESFVDWSEKYRNDLFNAIGLDSRPRAGS